jgi:hypothetical protein
LVKGLHRRAGDVISHGDFSPAATTQRRLYLKFISQKR